MDLLLINQVLSWALFGLIWVIQLVHYPAFIYVAPAQFKAFHQHHTFSISLIVMPLMVGEAIVGAYLAFESGWDLDLVVPLLAVGLIWASTFLIQIPLHNKLGHSKNNHLIKRLTTTNWIRTILWTLKAIWLTWVI